MSAVEGIYNFLALSARLATAGQPTAEQFAAVRNAGYEVVINLLPVTSPQALPDEDKIVAALGFEYIHIPVDWQDPAIDDAERFFDALDRHRDRRLFVHCAANMRVAAFLYLYRTLRHDMNPSEAEADLHRIWSPNDTWQRFMESFPEERQAKTHDPTKTAAR